ncbi:MAG: hypothetical protein V7746_22680, partial [Halioglobus sp.]
MPKLFSKPRIFPLLFLVLSISVPSRAFSQEVVVVSGIDDVIQWMEKENWWGEAQRGQQLTVPHAMMTGFSDRWRENAMKMPVPQKKEIFYRLMLPLIMHANTMVLARRAELQAMNTQLKGGNALSTQDLEELRRLAILLRIVDTER